MSACRSCGAEIIWAETASGKRIPMDSEPVMQRGLYLLYVEDDGRRTILSASSRDAPKLYQSHFATCPNADAHRK